MAAGVTMQAVATSTRGADREFVALELSLLFRFLISSTAGDALCAEVLEVVLYVREVPKACAVCCSVY